VKRFLALCCGMGHRHHRQGAAIGCLLVLSSLGCLGPGIDLGPGGTPFNPVRDGGPGTDPEPDDGGMTEPDPSPDPNPEPDPEPDADGGTGGVGLGGACDNTANRCADGLYCLANIDGTEGNSCVRACGYVEDNVLYETPEVCGMYEACNTVLDESISFALAAVCLPIQYSRDFPCFAFEDPDVCALDRGCLATEVAQNEEGQTVVAAMRCKDTCTYGAPDADDGCNFDDVCLPDPIGIAVSEPQLSNPDNPASTITCDPEDCDGDGVGCPCDLEAGYRCAENETPTCGRLRGVCGTTAPYLDEGDPISFDDICNEENASKYCERAPFLDIEEDPALAICAGFAAPPVEGDGICIALCHQPAFDYDGNGTIDLLGAERELSFNCPEDWSCTDGFARSVGLVATGPVQIPCSSALCPTGEPCAQCPGGVECVDEPYLLQPVCAAVFGTCHPPLPEPPPPPDAGPIDAGPIDAGPIDGGQQPPTALDGGLDAGDGDPVDASGGVGDGGAALAADAGLDAGN
jgi:hypothetical protein